MYCPKIQPNNWQNQLLGWELYKERIAPHFKAGENPLPTPGRFWDTIKLAKNANRKIGFNVSLLSKLSLTMEFNLVSVGAGSRRASVWAKLNVGEAPAWVSPTLP
jgi:hypothetical protein